MDIEHELRQAFLSMRPAERRAFITATARERDRQSATGDRFGVAWARVHNAILSAAVDTNSDAHRDAKIFARILRHEGLHSD